MVRELRSMASSLRFRPEPLVLRRLLSIRSGPEPSGKTGVVLDVGPYSQGSAASIAPSITSCRSSARAADRRCCPTAGPCRYVMSGLPRSWVPSGHCGGVFPGRYSRHRYECILVADDTRCAPSGSTISIAPEVPSMRTRWPSVNRWVA